MQQYYFRNRFIHTNVNVGQLGDEFVAETTILLVSPNPNCNIHVHINILLLVTVAGICRHL